MMNFEWFRDLAILWTVADGRIHEHASEEKKLTIDQLYQLTDL